MNLKNLRYWKLRYEKKSPDEVGKGAWLGSQANEILSIENLKNVAIVLTQLLTSLKKIKIYLYL